MADRQRLIVECTNLTPLYLGDADQSCELRPPAIKGPLRYWYRAIDPEFRIYEPRFFGGRGEGAGQGPFALRVRGPTSEDAYGPSWPDDDVRRFDDTRHGTGRNTRNGVKYLGFPFASRDHHNRTWLRPGAKLRLQFDLHREIPAESRERFRRALVASIWLLSHFGGLGSRSRRGFGSLHLTGWHVDAPRRETPTAWDELSALPLLHPARSGGDWISGAEEVVRVMRGWFGTFDAPTRVLHPFLGPKYGLLVASGLPASEASAPRRTGAGAPRRDGPLGPRPGAGWMAALDSLGRLMQDFRVRAAPDYQAVKDEIAGVQQLTTLPERATFGLPITFQYSGVTGRATFVPFDLDALERGKPLERHPSLLLARLVQIGASLHPAFVRLDGPVPGGQQRPGAFRDDRMSLKPPAEGARSTMDGFLAYLTGGGRR